MEQKTTGNKRFRDIGDDRVQLEALRAIESIENNLDAWKVSLWIQKLGQPHRQVLEWSFGLLDDELSDAEIGRRLGKTEYHIKKIREDGLKQIRRMMKL